MTLYLLCGRWWLIVCPPSGAFCNVQKVCIPGAVRSLLPTLTYSQWFTRLPVVHLFTQFPMCLPDMDTRAKELP